MSQQIYKTPEGTRDLLFEECGAYNAVKNELSALFRLRGYGEVLTPTLEYYDLFMRSDAGFRQEELYKLTGSDGRLLVLRPDITLPIARLVSSRLREAPLPLRLHYCERVFLQNPGLKGRSDEFTQSGVELVGAQGMLADLEVMALAADALQTAGSADYTLELGHVGVFHALMRELDADDRQKEEIRQHIEAKNYAGLGLLLDALEPSDAARALRALPRLFGGSEVFGEAERLLGPAAAEPLDELRRLWENLESLRLDGHVRVDLGLVHRSQYYTGTVFRGYMEGSGTTVLSGGRYDHLFGTFGMDLPATGFMVNVNALAAQRAQAPAAPEDAGTLLFAKPGAEPEAVRRAQALCAAGERCELLAFTSDAACATAAKARGAARYEIIG